MRASTAAASGRGVGVLVGERIVSRGLSESFAQYHGGGQSDIEGARPGLQRDAQPEVGGVVDLVRYEIGRAHV